ncbi:S-methyl-5'-thioadenosine phosphorylase [Nannocystaceae bacterium ST9]
MAKTTPHPASPEARAELVLGVVGGSGLYGMDELEGVERVAIETPFGPPSSPYTVGRLARPGRPSLKAVFLPRHGTGHLLMPGEINYRANIHGFKQLGVTHLLSVTAVGSLREDIAPGHLITPDQFIDRTRGREQTFFGNGCVAHVQLGDPIDDRLRALVGEVARGVLAGAGSQLHERGTLVVMEGPAFSTRAESNLYRQWGADIIGMTAWPEAALAREAEIAYAVLATATDYDCWRVGEAQVSVDSVLAVLAANVERARAIVVELAKRLPVACAELPWPRALDHALITDPGKIPAVTRERLDLLVGHHLVRS